MPIDLTDALRRFVRDHAEAAASHRAERRKSCPSLVRFHLARTTGWTPVEQSHLTSCPHCQNTLAILRRLDHLNLVSAAFSLAGLQSLELGYSESLQHSRTAKLLAEAVLLGRLDSEKIHSIVRSVAVTEEQAQESAFAGSVAGTDRVRFHRSWSSEDGRLHCALDESDEGVLAIRIDNPSREYRRRQLTVELIFAGGDPVTFEVKMLNMGAEETVASQQIGLFLDLSARLSSGFAAVVDPVVHAYGSTCPGQFTLVRFLASRLPDAEPIRHHLEDFKCELCNRRITLGWPRRIAALVSWLDHRIRALQGAGRLLPEPNRTRQRALALTCLALAMLAAWEGVRRYQLEYQFVGLTGSVETIRKENEALRRTSDALKTDNQSLGMLLAGRESELERVKALLSQPDIQSSGLISVQDTSGTLTLSADGTVFLTAVRTLPPDVSQSVREFVNTSSGASVTPLPPNLDVLRGDLTRSALKFGRDSAKATPVPLSPVLTAIRSSRPTLEWRAIPGAQEYKVIVANRDDNVVWEYSAGTQTHASLPSGVLQRGGVYFWQVEALAGRESTLSLKVGFWLLDERMLRDVEDAERRYESSALVRASVYAGHGLYEDALKEVERLEKLNPKKPQLQATIERLRRQLGRE